MYSTGALWLGSADNASRPEAQTRTQDVYPDDGVSVIHGRYDEHEFLLTLKTRPMKGVCGFVLKKAPQKGPSSVMSESG